MELKYLTTSNIDLAHIVGCVQSTAAGAVVLFLGTTRDMTGGRETESLDYQCYPEMANRKLGELEAEAAAAVADCRVLPRSSPRAFASRRSERGRGGEHCRTATMRSPPAAG